MVQYGPSQLALNGWAAKGAVGMDLVHLLCSTGPERRSAVIEQHNKEIVAYHEGGHALVALYTPGEAVARCVGRRGGAGAGVCL